MISVEAKLLDLLWACGPAGVGPRKTTYGTKHYQVIVGIGNDHTATVTIDEEALEVLCELLGEDSSNYIEEIK